MNTNEIESLKRTASARIGTAKIALDNLHYPHVEAMQDYRTTAMRQGYSKTFKTTAIVENFLRTTSRQQSPPRSSRTLFKDRDVRKPTYNTQIHLFLCWDRMRWSPVLRDSIVLLPPPASFSTGTPDDRWWTVILYNVLTGYDRERMWHSREDSERLCDGEIVWNIRTRQIEKKYLEIGKWVGMLHSRSKQNDLNRLQSQQFRLVWKELDRLLPFRGLWAVEFFASCRRILRKSPEVEVDAGFLYWSYCRRLGGDKYLDPKSVELLEGCSPRLSSTDRKHVKAASNELFTRALDPEIREILISRCLHPNKGILIPPLRTFSEDTKYIEPAAMVLRILVPERFKGSLLEALKSSGSWQDVEDFWPRYRRLWLFALRYFPSITDIQPLLDETQATKVDRGNGALNALAQLAAKEGFMAREIQLHLQNGGSDAADSPSSAPPELTQSTTRRWSKTHNCGKPYWPVFREAFPFMHLEYIDVDYQAQARELTAFAVARNIFKAFLGSGTTCDGDMASSCYSVPSQVAGLDDEQAHNACNAHMSSAQREQTLIAAPQGIQPEYVQPRDATGIEMLSERATEQTLITAPQLAQFPTASGVQQTRSISPAQGAPRLRIANGFPRQLEPARPSELLSKYSNHIAIDYNTGKVWAFAENDNNKSFREYLQQSCNVLIIMLSLCGTSHKGMKHQMRSFERCLVIQAEGARSLVRIWLAQPDEAVPWPIIEPAGFLAWLEILAQHPCPTR